MKYYISKIIVEKGDPDKGEPTFVSTEKILSQADTLKNTQRRFNKWRAIGIDDIYLVLYEAKRYKRLMKEQKRRTKPVKLQDIAETLVHEEEPESEVEESGT